MLEEFNFCLRCTHAKNNILFFFFNPSLYLLFSRESNDQWGELEKNTALLCWSFNIGGGLQSPQYHSYNNNC